MILIEPVKGMGVPFTSVVFPDSTRTVVHNFFIHEPGECYSVGSVFDPLKNKRCAPRIYSINKHGELSEFVLRTSLPGNTRVLTFNKGIPQLYGDNTVFSFGKLGSVRASPPWWYRSLLNVNLQEGSVPKEYSRLHCCPRSLL